MYDTVIVIPYRNRKSQLDKQLKDTVPILKQQFPSCKVVVIEQSKEHLFNRGALCNVAFKLYKNDTKYFMTHDVDIYPTEKCIEEFYKKEVNDDEVLGIYTSIYDTLGGLIKLSSHNIVKINGFPNDIYGWGAEDKALQNRSQCFSLKKTTTMTNDKEYPEYLLRLDDIKDRNRTNHGINHHKHYILFNHMSQDTKKAYVEYSGINNIQFKILERENIAENVELIKVKLD